MIENNSLYFIPILIKAFESENAIDAMNDALQKIRSMGEHAEFKEGYEQFEQFINIGIEKETKDSTVVVDKILLGIATHSIKLSSEEYSELIHIIKGNPELNQKYKNILKRHGADPPIEIEIYKENILLDSSMIQLEDKELTFTKIEPGNYFIQLSNGRLLWEGEITAKDIILDVERSESEYSLAAETDEADVKSTRIIELIKDEVKLEVYAGLEFGKFKIIIK